MGNSVTCQADSNFFQGDSTFFVDAPKYPNIFDRHQDEKLKAN